jgi:hypothetical protein
MPSREGRAPPGEARKRERHPGQEVAHLEKAGNGNSGRDNRAPNRWQGRAPARRQVRVANSWLSPRRRR